MERKLYLYKIQVDQKSLHRHKQKNHHNNKKSTIFFLKATKVNKETKLALPYNNPKNFNIPYPISEITGILPYNIPKHSGQQQELQPVTMSAHTARARYTRVILAARARLRRITSFRRRCYCCYACAKGVRIFRRNIIVAGTNIPAADPASLRPSKFWTLYRGCCLGIHCMWMDICGR